MRFSNRRLHCVSSTRDQNSAPNSCIETPRKIRCGEHKDAVRVYDNLVGVTFCSHAVPTMPPMRIRNSVLIRFVASFSPPSPRAPHSESTSSMKMTDGAFSIARSKSCLTSRSLSPSHLDTRSDDEIEKKVAFASVATALARYDYVMLGMCVCVCIG